MLTVEPKPNPVGKKQGWVDYAKGIAILLVVYKHVLLGLEIRIEEQATPFLDFFHAVGSNFRMPLFFFISGVFYAVSLQRHTPIVNMERKFATIYYPFLVWGIVQICLQVLFAGATNSDRSLWDVRYLFTNPRQIDQFWYLATLFYVNILFTILYLISGKNIWIIFVSSLAMFGMFLWKPFSVPSILTDMFYYQLFFVFGYFASDLFLKKEFQFSMAQPWIMAGTSVVFIASLYMQKILVTNAYSFQFLNIGINILSGIFLAYTVSIYLDKYHRLRFLAFIGKYSLYIYIMHVILSGFLRTILISKLGITNMYVLLVIMIPICSLFPIWIYRLFADLKLRWVFNGDWILKMRTVNYSK